MISWSPRIFSWKERDCEFGFPTLLIPRLLSVAPLTCSSDYADQVWIWENEEGSKFYFDVGEIVRFRVEMEEWHDQIPNAPDLGEGAPVSEKKPPYSIIVCAHALYIFHDSC